MSAFRVILLFILVVYSTQLSRKYGSLPTYYTDPTILQLLSDRQNCMQSNKNESIARMELKLLKDESATEYFRSHELFAHDFFVENIERNPLRVMSYQEAEFEYIPLLPLHWRSSNGDERCGYKALINSLLKVQEYLQQRDQKLVEEKVPLRPRFSVTSTFNLRTALGTGMPTQLRRGEAWDSMSKLIMSLSIGHYERWPQCPDLLRKSFKLNIELPYVITTTDKITHQSSEYLADTKRKVSRTNTFFFSGNFELFGPEMVCSVRNAVLAVSNRTDIVVVNSTAKNANSALQTLHIAKLASSSVFCIVAKGDSYSTSFFYTALSHGCIPIVISDWLVFSLPWLIPYEKFVFRVLEEDFVMNPHYVLDFIRDSIGAKWDLLQQMREAMREYTPLLSFNRVSSGSAYHLSLLRHDPYLDQRLLWEQLYRHAGSRSAASTTSTINSSNHSGSSRSNDRPRMDYVYLPLQLMLLELRYSQQPHQFFNNAPCLRPSMCAPRPGHNQSAPSYKPNPTDYEFAAPSRVRTMDVMFIPASTGSTAGAQQQQVGYTVGKDGYQVQSVDFPAFPDLRPHLCRHNTRLIGSYKVVYFMQCVRILWPLHPGTFKPVDNISRLGMPASTGGVIAKYRGGRYPVDPEGISLKDMEFVQTFHNASRSKDWILINYPAIADRSRIQSFS